MKEVTLLCSIFGPCEPAKNGLTVISVLSLLTSRRKGYITGAPPRVFNSTIISHHARTGGVSPKPGDERAAGPPAPGRKKRVSIRDQIRVNRVLGHVRRFEGIGCSAYNTSLGVVLLVRQGLAEMSSPPASPNGNPANPRDEAFQKRYIPTPIPGEDDKEFKDYMKREYRWPGAGDTTVEITRPFQPGSELHDQEG
jgi:hypothetical protein